MRFVLRDAVSVSNFMCAGALSLGVREAVRDGMREWYARVVCASGMRTELRFVTSTISDLNHYRLLCTCWYLLSLTRDHRLTEDTMQQLPAMILMKRIPRFGEIFFLWKNATLTVCLCAECRA